jgi:putative hemolysin
MELDPTLEIIAVLLLVLVNGFVVLAEFAVIASRKARLLQQVHDRKFGALAAARFQNNPDTFLAAIQVMITVIGILLGIFSGAAMLDSTKAYLDRSSITFLARYSEIIAYVLVVIPVTAVTVLVGELVPKLIALTDPERYARYTAGPMKLIVLLTVPFTRTLEYMARLIFRALGLKKNLNAGMLSEEDIRHAIIEGQQKGVFDATESDLIRSAFAFSDSTVRRAMKPRTDVEALNIDTPAAEVLKIIRVNHYSRYPVYEKSIDHVAGVFYAKDLIHKDINWNTFKLRDHMREPLFFPDSMPMSKALAEFQKGKTHLAIILDEFGGTAGIITLEDVLEEIVDEILDEDDAEVPPIVKQSDTIVFADGGVWPGDINALLDTHLPDNQAETVAGLFMDTIGRLPDKYESIKLADTRMTVLTKDKNRILRVKVERVARSTED